MFDIFQSTLSTKGLSNALTSAALDRLGASGTTAADARQFSQELKNSLGAALSSAAANVDQTVTSAKATLAQYQSTLSVYTASKNGSEQPAASANAATATATGASQAQQKSQAQFDMTVPQAVAQAAGTNTTSQANETGVPDIELLSSSLVRSSKQGAASTDVTTAAAGANSNAADAAVSQTNLTTSFANFEEFKTWESSLGGTFAADYEAPDYVHMMGLSLGGGEGDAFKRYLFFKNNPQYAADFQAIHEGKLSQFPTDGSTLIRSDVSAMPADVADAYRQNPDALRLAEGLNMDPVLTQRRLAGTLDVPKGVNASEWLMEHKWTSSGTVANDNRLSFANASFVGMSGTGAGNYRMAKYGDGTGQIVDFDGAIYNPTTGQKTGQASAATLAALYGTDTTTA